MSTGNNTIQAAVERYLKQRRRLGFELGITGQQLMRFARYADARGHQGPLTLDLQLGWAREHVKRTGPVTWARRLEVVRPFAAYYRQFHPDTEIPDLHTFGPGHRRLAPHIYTGQEVCDLLEQAGRLPPLDGVRPATYRTLFGLIASVGLRLSEALNLRDGDVDLRRACLTVRHTKFKNRVACRCTAVSYKRSTNTGNFVIGVSKPVQTCRSSCRNRAAPCRRGRFKTSSSNCVGNWLGRHAGTTRIRAFRTCATVSPWLDCCDGMRQERPSIMPCSGYALTLVMPASRTLTGTSAGRRN
ncbi:hypothetical protein [Cupriavidus basilensis]